MKQRSRDVLKILNNGTHSSAELAIELHVSQSSISRTLRELIELRKIERTGGTTVGARYALFGRVEGAEQSPANDAPVKEFARYGEEAFEPPRVAPGDRETLYPQMAEAALAQYSGPSPQQPLPSFAAAIMARGSNVATGQVRVWFTPPLSTDEGARAADALRAQEVALTELPCAHAHSRYFTISDRLYREVARIDRLHGVHYNLVPAQSMADVERLHAGKRIDRATMDKVRLAAAYQCVISGAPAVMDCIFLLDDRWLRSLELAPLDHAYALLDRPIAPPVPAPELACAWPQAKRIAYSYWLALTIDSHVSDRLRQIAQASLSFVF